MYVLEYNHFCYSASNVIQVNIIFLWQLNSALWKIYYSQGRSLSFVLYL